MLGYTNQCDTAQCYYTSNYPEILDWNKACINNKDTHDVKEYSKIRGIKQTASKLKQIISGYRASLKEGSIQIFNGKLVLYEPILENHRYVALIIISQFYEKESLQPFPLRYQWRNLVIWIVFLWSRLREAVNKWVNVFLSMRSIQCLEKREEIIAFSLARHYNLSRHMITWSSTVKEPRSMTPTKYYV